MQSDSRFRLEGQTVLVTGATGYLGREISIAVGAAGAKVLVNSRSYDRCYQFVEELLKLGFRAEAAVFDVTEASSIELYFSNQTELHLNGLVNNAYTGGTGSINISGEADYLKSYGVSVIAAHRVLKAALPSMKRSFVSANSASVVNIASMYGIVSPDQRLYSSEKQVNPPFYGASKAALIQWTKYAACEFGSTGVRVNCVSPGPFPSSDVQRSDPLFVKKLADRVPIGRVGDAEEIGGPLVFLLSNASSFVNGANLIVDGGWTCW